MGDLGQPRRTSEKEPVVTGRFLRRLPLTLVIGIVVWQLLRPITDTAVAGGAQLLIRSFEYPKVTRLVVDDHRAQVRRSDFRSGSKIPAIPLTETTFNLIVLLALQLALPRPFSRPQLERLFMGCCVLYVTQAANLVFHVKTLYATGLGEWSTHYYSDTARNVFGFLRYFTDLPGRFGFPFMIWLGFNWDVVMRMLRANGEEAPEPKKSSQKRKTV
jgi:hypothetical protein